MRNIECVVAHHGKRIEFPEGVAVGNVALRNQSDLAGGEEAQVADGNQTGILFEQDVLLKGGKIRVVGFTQIGRGDGSSCGVEQFAQRIEGVFQAAIGDIR